MNNAEILQDFSRRYSKTYVKLCVENKGIEVVAFIKQITSSDDKFAVLSLDTQEFGTIQTNFGSEEYKIKFTPPRAGVFQSGTDALLILRKCERQYSKGLSSATSFLYSPPSRIVPLGFGWTLQRVADAYAHKTHFLKEAVFMLANRHKRSVALEDDFSVTLPMCDSREEYMMFHRMELIGKLDSKGELLRVYEPMYEDLIQGVIKNG